MKNKVITVVVVAAIMGGILVLNRYEPKRLADAHYEAELKVQKELNGGEEPEKRNPFGISAKAINLSVKKTMENMRIAQSGAQDDSATVGGKDYRVTFECSNGEIVLEVTSELAPLGAAQFRKAVEDGVYDGAPFFRVIPGFMAQFGIPGDPEKAGKWDEATIMDDPVKASNTRGTMSFATSGPNSRTTQLFINFGDNSNLDDMDFSPFARVIKGMDVVDSIFSGYGPSSNDQDGLKSKGSAYLITKFPKLDFIKKATIQAIPAAEVEVEGDSSAEEEKPEDV